VPFTLRRRVTLDREWQNADVGASPSRVLDGRALVAAARAPRALPQHVTRCAGAPPDDGDRARQRRVVLALLAIQPKPGRSSVQVAERGAGAGRLHGTDWTPDGRAKSSR
jgi:hypothetical protein